MKIVLTGGGSGGHFYPLIAVAESIQQYTREHRLLEPQLLYLANTPYNKAMLEQHAIEFVHVPSGKLRRYFSILNLIDIGKLLWGICVGLWKMLIIFPDVVFSRGGYPSIPVLFAARILRIPVIVHESDTKPSRATLFGARFAKKIAISFPETADYFAGKEVALTGHPVRRELMQPLTRGAHEYLDLDSSIPVVLVLGGSQGAETINETIIEALPELLSRFQVIHQCGDKLYEKTKQLADVYLADSSFKSRYRLFPYLDDLALRMSAGAARVAITRAGAGSIFELAFWGVPAIIIPIPESVSHDQRTNAYTYARTGAAEVIEEHNLSPHLLVSEVTRIIEDTDAHKRMQTAAKGFTEPEAADKIAREILDIALEHEK
mgnify:CR=1 FL=1